MSTTRPPMHDDRFSAPSEASRRGAHRARTKALSAGLPVLAGIAVILLVIGGIYVVMGNGGTSPSSDTPAAAEPTSTENLPSSDATTAPSQSSPSTSTTTADQPDDSTTTTSANTGAGSGNVDKSLSVVVLNSTGVKGLALRGKSALESKGWNVTRTGNSINQGLSTTKIYYGNAENKESADQVRSDLGYGQVFQDSSVTRTGVTVVLGHDAE